MSSETPIKICCVCKLECQGTVYEVDSHTFHPKCFCCSKCNCKVDPTNLRFRNEQLYCYDCYNSVFGRVCSVCKQYILDDTFVETMGQFFHTNHFVCFICKNPFKENRFLKKEVYYDGETKYRPLCHMCCKFLKSVPCHNCLKKISGCRGYDGKNWYHKECYMVIESAEKEREKESLPSILEDSGELSEQEKNNESDILRLSLQIEEERKVLEEEKKQIAFERQSLAEEKRRFEQEKKDLERMRSQQELLAKPVVKELPKPVVKELPKPVVKELPKPVVKELPKPIVKEQPKPVVKEQPKPVVKEQPKPVIKEQLKPIVKEQPKPEEDMNIKPIFRRDNIQRQLRESYSPIQNSVRKEEKPELAQPRLSYSLQGQSEDILSLPNDQLPIYSYQQLTTLPYPADVDLRRREYHLSDEEFEQVFGMTKTQFESLQQWKRQQLRKKYHLF